MESTLSRRIAQMLDALFDGARWTMLLAPLLLALPGVARAEDELDYGPVNYSGTVTWVEEDEEVEATPAPELPRALGRYGAFHLVSATEVAVDGVIDADSPAQFAALLVRNPGIRTLVLQDCPGSEDDDANLKLARMVRRAGIDTFVPATGSINSGAVELFLAGANHYAAPGSRIGVHSWIDDEGHQATDFPPSAPVHSVYLRYYQDMGMTPAAARAFYDFTNRAASANEIHIMTRAELQRYGLIAS